VTKVLKLILALSLVVCLIVFSDSAFAKWDRNSVVIPPGINYWSSSNVSSPSIIKVGSMYQLWYQGFDGYIWTIGTAKSVDGKAWQLASQPDVVPDNDERDVLEPSVVYTDKYYMFYDSRSVSFEQKIRMAVSDDGINWTKHPVPVLTPSEPWESRGVTDPSVIFHDGKYRMFYGGWGTGPWQIGYAESTDGINWTKSPNNPLALPNLGHLNGPSASFYQGKYHLFYHTGDGIPNNIYHVSSDNLTDWECVDGCTVITNSLNGFDSLMTLAPAFLADNGRNLLYYGGSDGSKIQIGLAIETLEAEKPVIVFIPGLFSSWNREALLHNQTVAQTDWELNPIVKEYSGINETLLNLGYLKGENYFFFNYDWRKNLSTLVDDLNLYLAAHSLKEKRIILIGHSLGGLIARLYVQEKGTENIEKIITVGSPHQGVPQVYKALAGGEVSEDNPWWYLAEKLALQLFREGLETDREILKRELPVLEDLLSTYPYLYGFNNQPILMDSYQFTNEYLFTKNLSLGALDSLLFSLSGNAGNTTSGYVLGGRSHFDRILNLYPEGRPIQTIRALGDFVVTELSAKTNQAAVLNLDHGALIRNQAGIQAILDQAGIEYSTEEIVEGESTQIFPSLVFLVLSSARLEVEIGNQTYREEKGILLVPNYQGEPVLIKAIGQSTGNYEIRIGYLKPDRDVWSSIHGTILHPNEEIDIYSLTLAANSNLVLNADSLLEQIRLRLQLLYEKTNNKWLYKAYRTLNKPKIPKGTLKFLLTAYSQLNAADLNELIEIISLIQEYYTTLPDQWFSRAEWKLYNLKYHLQNAKFKVKKQKLLHFQHKNSSPKTTRSLSLAKEYLDQLNSALKTKKTNLTEFFYLVVEALLQGI